MSANGMREGTYDPLEDAVLAAMVAGGWAETEDVQAAFDALDAEIEAERILCACGDEITLDHYGDGARCPNCLAGDVPARAWGEYVPQTDAERAEVMRLACADAGASDEYQRRFIPGDVPDDEPTSPMLMPLDDIEGNGRGPT